MIWYNETLQIQQQQPPGSSVRLVGTYSIPDNSLNPPIIVRLDISTRPEDTTLQFVVFTHTPSGLNSHEEPTKEDILDKYRSKLAKLRDKILATPFNQLSTLSTSSR